MPSRTARAAPPPLPAPSWDSSWPVCSAERPDYCISRFEVGGVDRLATPNPETRLDVLGTANDPAATVIDRVEWSINSQTGGQDLSSDMLDQDILVTIRTGRLRTSYGVALARRGFVPSPATTRMGGR